MTNFQKKIQSRKFLVWVVWLVFAVLTCKYSELPKEEIFQFFGYVSLIYIGGNVAQKWLEKKQ